MAWRTGRPAGSRYPAGGGLGLQAGGRRARTLSGRCAGSGSADRRPVRRHPRTPRPAPDLPGWPAALAAPGIPASAAEIRSALAGLADAATIRYLSYGHGNAIMLVHSATAPGAVLRTLPALDAELWAPSLAASWAAAAALTAVYAPAVPAARTDLPGPPSGPHAAEDTFARAVDHGDEHVIKFADTAADAYARTGNPDALAAAVRAADLIER